MRGTHRYPPDTIRHEEQLDELLSEPTDEVQQALLESPADVVILGAGGKVGPALAVMARRALDQAGSSRRVIAVSRFTNKVVRQYLDRSGIETVSADLFLPGDVGRLPDAGIVYFLLGRKFGTTGCESLTWASNVALPTIASQRYAGCRIVAISTLCVYPYVSVESGGSRESDPASPIGEYAMSTLGRERVFQHFSTTTGTPTALLRLTYAVEPRYGVLVDIAQRVWREEPVDLSMAHVNILWQADVCARILIAISLAASPARVLNLAGAEHYSVRDLASRLGALLGKQPRFEGGGYPDAWLPAPSAEGVLSRPSRVTIDQLLRWTADWIRSGQPTHGKPTRFEVRNGEF